MRIGLIVVLGVAAAAAATIAVTHFRSSAPQRADTPSPSNTSEAIEPQIADLTRRAKSFNAEAYARAAIAAHDYRHVVLSDIWPDRGTPGIMCIASRAEARRRFFGDVGYPGYDELQSAIVKAADAFNRTLTSDPRYPDKDVCFPSEQRLAGPDATRIAAKAARRPAIVDLHTAVRAQDLAQVNGFIAKGADVNAIDEWHHTPLMWAVGRKNLPIIRELFDAGAQFDRSGAIRTNALTIAVRTGDATVVHELLSAARQRAAAPSRTGVPLAEAAALGRADLVDILISFDEVPDPGNGQAWMEPLDTAVKRQCKRCLEAMLARAGAALASATVVHELIDREIGRPQSSMLVPLVRAALDGVSYSEATRTALNAAIEHNQANAVRYLLHNAPDANLLLVDEVETLRGAAEQGNEPTMATVAAVASKRRLDLDAAIQSNDQERIRAAVPKGATLAQDHAFMPLMRAAVSSNGTTIETLLELGAKIDARVGLIYSRSGSLLPEAYLDDGTTALYYAVKHLNVDAARTLLRLGADLDTRSGPSPLLADVGRLWEEVPAARQQQFVDLLLSGISSNRRQARADLMLASAASWGRRGLIRILIERGAHSCATVDYHTQAVASVASDESLAVMKLLIEHCPDWSTTAPVARETLKNALSGLQPFTPARLEIVRYLLAQKIPLPSPQYGATSLDNAVTERNTELIELLLAAGADINEICQGLTALDWAHMYLENDKIIDFLCKRGAKTAEELGVKRPEPPFPF